MNLPDFIIPALENIYISPLELCNLNCKYCYTNKTKSILTNSQILKFIDKYSSYLRESCSLNLASVLFCGGEVFALKDFPSLINQLSSQNIFSSIITNGTLDILDQVQDPNSVQLLVSLDGPKHIHDANRGPGNFDKSINFIKHALSLNFHVEIMFLVTNDSYPYIDSIEKQISESVQTGRDLPLHINYITIKSQFYTSQHPLSQDNPNSQSLSAQQIIHIKQNYPSIPAKDFGCFQLSLQSNGNFYGCCESPTPIGTLQDPINTVVEKFVSSLNPCTQCRLFSHHNSEVTNFEDRSEREPAYAEPEGSEDQKISSRDIANKCLGCTSPDFLCGYKKELQLINCTDVVNLFNSPFPQREKHKVQRDF